MEIYDLVQHDVNENDPFPYIAEFTPNLELSRKHAESFGEQLDPAFEESAEKKGRDKWSSEDATMLVRQVHLHGKNWSKIIQIFHSFHRLTNMKAEDYTKLRKKYNALKEKYEKPYKRPKFIPTKKRNKEQGIQEEREFNDHHTRLEEEHTR